jgi:hypothetical protein
VIQYKVHNDADIVFPGISCQMLEVLERSIHRIDIFVIRDVIPKVDLRRGIAGCNPNGINSQILQIVEVGVDTLEISDAIIVAIGKASRVDLIEDRMLPPLVPFRLDCSLLCLTKRK